MGVTQWLEWRAYISLVRGSNPFARTILLGYSLVVEHRTLTPIGQVRILVPQPLCGCDGIGRRDGLKIR